MNVFIMQSSIVRPFGRDAYNSLIGFEGENGSRTFVVRTQDDVSNYTVSLIIGEVDCGSMTKTAMSDGSTMLSLTLASGMIGTSGDKICQLIMADGTTVRKSSQFVAHVGGTNDITQVATDSATLIVISEAITQMISDSIPPDYSELLSDVDDLKSDVDDLTDRVEALEEGGSGGSGITDDVKTALMNLVNHIAWDDDDPTGQTYITALYNALYPPAPPASLTSITAVYTQGGTVYATDTLNDLKPDLVVTAHYSDNTSHAVTDYTLSGTLAVGTSTIAVAYGGKTTTFTVTVTGALYPLENGTHTFTSNDRVLTVTNGNHFVYEWPNATTAAVNGAYLNLSTVSDNDTSAEDASNLLVNDPLFTIPANAQVVFAIKNIQLSNVGTAGSSNKYAFNMRNGSTNLNFSDGDKGINDTADIIFTKTVSEDTPVTCVYLYISRQFSRMEADISLTVNNVRWI